MTISSVSRAAFAALLIAGVAVPASAQGKSKGEEKKSEKSVAKAVKDEDKRRDRVEKDDDKRRDKAEKARDKRDDKVEKAIDKRDDGRERENDQRARDARRHVTSSQAVVVTRDVLVANGYQIVNVVPSGNTQIITFRRGNRGNGRGLGPIERIVIVPSGNVVQFQSVPQPLLATILRRLGM